MALKADELMWVAGLIEGEGSFSRQSKTCVSIGVASTDRDVIERLRQWTGMGNIFKARYTSKLGRKPLWLWQVSKKRDVARLLLAIYPVMSERRQGQIRRAVEHLRTERGDSKLTVAQVAEIRRRVAAGEVQRVIAADFGIHQSHVSGIASGKKRRAG